MRNDPLIPNLAVVTDIRVDTPDVKTFRVVGLDGKKPFVHIPGQCAMLSVPGVRTTRWPSRWPKREAFRSSSAPSPSRARPRWCAA